MGMHCSGAAACKHSQISTHIMQRVIGPRKRPIQGGSEGDQGVSKTTTETAASPLLAPMHTFSHSRSFHQKMIISFVMISP